MARGMCSYRPARAQKGMTEAMVAAKAIAVAKATGTAEAIGVAKAVKVDVTRAKARERPQTSQYMWELSRHTMLKVAAGT